jgi:broad specificity phosphatase PhoE
VLLYDALGAPISAMHRIWLANASLSVIEERFQNGALIRRGVALLNDTSHLEKSL